MKLYYAVCLNHLICVRYAYVLDTQEPTFSKDCILEDRTISSSIYRERKRKQSRKEKERGRGEGKKARKKPVKSTF